MRTLTLEQLKELKPCAEGFKWYSQNIKTENVEEILHILAEHRWDWCRWLIVRLLDEDQNRELAIYCAELVLPIFEERYPDDNRPRLAIEATKDYIAGKIASDKLLMARRDAAYAAYAAYAADAAAADAAYAAADAAADAAAADAAYYAAYAADATYNFKQQIVSKVIELLKEMEK